MAYDTLSKEEAEAFLYGSNPKAPMPTQQPVQQESVAQQPIPVETSPRKSSGIAPPKMGKPSLNNLDAPSLVEQVDKANKQIQKATPAPQAPSAPATLVDQLTSNWLMPTLGLIGLAGMGAAGYYGYKKGANQSKGLKARDITQRIEPTMENLDVSKPAPTFSEAPIETPVETPKTKLAIEAEQKFGAPLADVENHFGVKITNLKDAEILTNNYKNSLPKGTVAAIPSGQQNIPTTTNGAFSQPSAYGQASNIAPETTKQPIEPTVEPKPEPTKSTEVKKLMTGTGREVVEGQGPVKKHFAKEYKSALDVPKGYVFVPNAQYADVMRNDLGQETYTKTYKGKEFPSTYPEAQAQVQEINRGLNRPTRAEMKAQGIEPPPVAKGIFKYVGDKKLVKVAGTAGALVAISDIANAAERGNFGETAVRSADFATDFLPLIAQIKQGLSPNEASAPTLGPKQLKAFEEAKKLGSPYRSVPPR